MKIAIPTSSNTLEGAIDPRFGRCTHFIIVETDDMSFEAFENKAQYEGHGAGTMAAQTIINKNVQAVIAGQYGPNAFMTLRAANITLYQSQGPIREALAKLKSNLTKKIENRKDYIHILYEEVWDKMKSTKPKLEKFNPEWLKHTEEVLIAFCQKIKEVTELDKVKPKQKQLKPGK